MNTNKIIKVITSEIEIITRHYTYEVMVDEARVDEFIKKMDGLCGHKEMYQELNKFSYKLTSKEDGKRFPTNDNFTSSVDVVELTTLTLNNQVIGVCNFLLALNKRVLNGDCNLSPLCYQS